MVLSKHTWAKYTRVPSEDMVMVLSKHTWANLHKSSKERYGHGFIYLG